MTERPGVLAALTDMRFTVFATPVLIRWIYAGCAVVIGCATLFWLCVSVVMLTWRSGWMWGVLGLFAAPLAGLLSLLVARVACEFTLARFRH